MPELPEVETVRQQLRTKIIGKTIASVEVFHNKTVAFDESIEERLRGKTIADIDRIGKLMIFSFKQEDDTFLLAHLKMTGQFFYHSDAEVDGGGHSVSKDDVAELPGRHTRVTYHFTDGTSLHFNDMRLFGYTKHADKTAVELARSAFGPEPIADDFDCEIFVEKLRKRKTSVKAVLLDQSFVAGLGNIYVDEALFQARVHPARSAATLTSDEAHALCQATTKVLQEAIRFKGTTFYNFADTDGERGNFSDRLQVFSKQGQACPREDGGVIEKTRVAGRGTHACPVCQK